MPRQPAALARRPRTLVALAALGLAATALAAPTSAALAATHPARAATTTPASWPMSGHDLANSRNNGAERTLTDQTVRQLRPRWSVSLPNYLAATPAVVGTSVYLADKGGHIRAFDTATGTTLWSIKVSAYTGITNDATRATPAVAGGRVIFGDQPPSATLHDGVSIIAANATNGHKLWRTVVDTTQTAKITGAPVIDTATNTVYVGVSSNDEASTSCCLFRGSVVALDARTGVIKWQTFTVPDGYSGGAVWGGNPVVDRKSGFLYVGTGNNYSVPDGVCTRPDQTDCAAPDPADHSDSVLALSLATGEVEWSYRTLDSDVWTHNCSGDPTCGPDWDFGSAPNEFTTVIDGVSRRLIGIGQKSGIYWTFDAYTGELVWETQVGPAPIMWGSATDNAQIYIGIDNRNKKPYTLVNGQTTYGGAWTALNAATGAIVWQTADPQGAGVGDYGFVTVAHGVVYAGSGAGEGNNMYALKTKNGSIVWSFASGGAVMGGAAVVDGSVYWASGYYTAFCPSGNPCGTSYTLWAFDTTSGTG